MCPTTMEKEPRPNIHLIGEETRQNEALRSPVPGQKGGPSVDMIRLVGDVETRFVGRVEAGVYRIVEEALTHVMRHRP